MPDTDLLRASRDGDQFHYHWAARQALKLLLPGADLTAIAIEGVSHDDTEGRDGEDVIDIAEYYGATGLREANRVVYRQLKHSTTRATEEWTVSGLAGTVSGFAEKYRRIRLESPGLEQKATFEFLSNRPVRDSVLRAIGILAAGGEPGGYAHEIKFLKQYAGFSDDADGEARFFDQLEVDPTAPGLLRLEGLFRLDLAGFLPGAPDVQPLLLKEMIARRATSLETNHVVERSTVLTALGVPPERVLPAPNLIDRPRRVIVTPQTRAIVDDIVRLAQRPVIVHAAGGIGKSVLTTQIERNLPAGSVTLVYDCFGNGGYRRSSSPRHQHQQGLVQLANEPAAHALCDPLIPAGTAQPADYARAFMARVRGAAEVIAAATPGALLALVVDAADNAALIARDGGERTFVADLLRETLPGNVRLVMLCRTERVDLLEPPPGVHRIELRKVHGRIIRIGREALRCLLARHGITFQRTKTWKESPDAERDAKLDRIEHVLDRFPDRVFAFDEFGPLGIRPTAGSGWAEQRRPDRLPATYHRTHGVRYFHGCYSVGDDRLWGVNRRKKGAGNTLAALKSIRAARPDGAPIYVIMDNLSAHKGPDIRRWAKKHKVELCFTPTYASWANPIEAHFGPLRQFTIANSNHPNHTIQTRALHAYLRWRNANARHRDVLAAERKERARIRSEKGIRWGGRPLTTAA